MKTDHFIIIGAQRSGTTYLYTILDEHPDICMAKPVRPEPKFFIKPELIEQGIDYYWNTFFSHYSGEKITGEKSTSYYEINSAVETIHRFFPDIKIIMMLRNPVYRALSNYQFSVDNGLEKRPLEEALFSREGPLKKFSTSVSPYDYINRGLYIDYIKKFADIIPKENMHFPIMEECINNRGEINKLYSFLGADTGFEPAAINTRVNQSSGLEKMSTDLKFQLYQLFSDSISQLENFTGKDLSIWRQ